ncbi:M43 family zinc metalloprotease [Fluviicola taffensis]|uniref:M43 family zinc metalloprotease n=1 Tax=Fluviicola taffensis TaxID=191579 RepID=UPI003137AC8B
MKSILFGCSVLFILSFNCFGQEGSFTCNHADPNTESLKQIQSLLAHSQKSADLKIIPVVFHVLHQNGSENISEAQILDALETLNADFQKLNADTSFVTAPFDTIIGKVNFEFRLATIDPNGNPTNGIDRIFSPLTTVGDETAMINAWDFEKYVNIWVVRFTLPGLSGFTSNPLVGFTPCNQGIVILHDYLGSIGTASAFASHFLTHEMGHYFGLYHTWGNQDLNQSCDFSDGIFDTPITKGNDHCNLVANSCDDTNDAASFAYWGFDPRDNFENFMEVSFCMKMFTPGQVEVIRSVAESPLYGRDQLWTTANLIATGTGPGQAPVSLAAPGSEFSILSNNNYSHPFVFGMICTGDSIQFSTENGLIPSGTTTYLWSFPGGSPSSSPLENPMVTYSNPGYYDVTLTATSPHGSTTATRNAMIYVSGSWAEFTGPTVQNFDVSGDFWQSQNTSDDSGYFQRIGTGGMQNTGCFLLGNHYDPDTTDACYEISENQINRSKDNLISPAFDLLTTSTVTVSFDYAFGCAAVPDSATEVLKVYYSRDCGESWIQKKVFQDTSLVTAFAPQNTNFIPSQNQWKHASFPFTSTANDTKTRFKFEFVASNYSNNLYIDNFVIDGVLGISDNELSAINVFPNPSKKGGTITISGLNVSASNLTITDLQGKQVYQKELVATSSEREIQLDANLRSGCYLVEVTQNNSRFLTRLIIE